MRAVLDTNVVISAAMSERSSPWRVFVAWQEQPFVWITSGALLSELTRALDYPRVQKVIHWDTERVAAFVAAVRNGSTEILEPRLRIDVLVADPDDNRLLEAAVAGNANYIVTGDTAVLRLERFEDVRIITPAAFLALLPAA